MVLRGRFFYYHNARAIRDPGGVNRSVGYSHQFNVCRIKISGGTERGSGDRRREGIYEWLAVMMKMENSEKIGVSAGTDKCNNIRIFLFAPDQK